MSRAIPILALMLIMTVAACARQEAASTGEQTATIGRPEPKPGELGTDALTQTVELDDGRSEAEGADLTNPDPKVRVRSPVPPTQTTQTQTTQTTTRP